MDPSTNDRTHRRTRDRRAPVLDGLALLGIVVGRPKLQAALFAPVRRLLPTIQTTGKSWLLSSSLLRTRGCCAAVSCGRVVVVRQSPADAWLLCSSLLRTRGCCAAVSCGRVVVVQQASADAWLLSSRLLRTRGCCPAVKRSVTRSLAWRCARVQVGQGCDPAMSRGVQESR